jgi:RNA polymerase primary sigma factor
MPAPTSAAPLPSRSMPRRRRGAGAPTSTPLRLYLVEIDATPLLSADEERGLARRIADGDAEARDHLVRANLRLVVMIARGYVGRGLPLEDLVAEGNLGLLRASEGFDASVGVRFTTYAAYWVKQSIRRAVINQGKPVRLPAYTFSLLAKWKRASATLAERQGREPTSEEIGRALRLPAKRVRIAVEALRAERQSIVSGAQDDDDPLGDVAEPKGRYGSPAEGLAEREDLAKLLAHVDRLGGREPAVIRHRFGLGTGVPMTLQQVGERLSLTREGVRQIEKAALQTLLAFMRAG